MKPESLSTRIALKIVGLRVGVPTWAVLYLNILISTVIISAPALNSRFYTGPGGPQQDTIWAVVLIVAALVTLNGLMFQNAHVVAVGALLGVLTWVSAFFMWMLSSPEVYELVLPATAIPMAVVFAFIYLKYSIVHRWMKENA